MTAVAAAGRRGAREGTRRDAAASAQARNMVADLLAVEPLARRELMRELAPRDLTVLLAATDAEFGTPYGLYVDDPVGFVEDVLGETVWSKQREILEAIAKYKRVAVPAGFGLGKCVHFREMIPLADGRLVPAEDLVGTEFEVMAWQEDGTQVRRRARAEWNAVEPTYRLRTASGREAIRNGEHPFWQARAVSTIPGGHAKGTVTLTPTDVGWTPLRKIEPGDLVLVPERHRAEGAERAPEHWPALLGYLLGDGGLTNSHITFTQKDGPALDEFRSLAALEGVELVPTNRPYHYRTRMIAPQYRRAAGASNPSPYSPYVELVREWGLYGKTAREKALPAWAWTLPNDQLAIVMGRLFACDAWVHYGERVARNRVNAQVAICLSSERLIRDVEMAMLRLGVWGNVRARTVTLEGKKFKAWEWSCRDREALVRLAEVIDMPGKNDKLQAMNAALAARSTARMARWPRREAPAGYRWDRVKDVEELPPAPTVAIEVEHDHTFVTTFVEHNTHISARIVAHFVCTRPVGSAMAVTTATRLRQVQRQLWPHIRRAHARAKLPGDCDQIQWSMPDRNGVRTTVAYGFTVPENDEAALQGIHEGSLLLIVDEAGGIPRNVGGGTNNLLVGDARMLAIGNPATDDEDSWFEGLCAAGNDPRIDDTITVSIPVTASPAITGEDAGLCADHPQSPPHSLASHLPNQKWIDDTIRDFGEDSPYVQAKVHARFPRGATARIIPTSWLELAANSPEPVGAHGEYPRLRDLLGLVEPSDYRVERGAWVRLGVDVAAAGGDELVIARSVGDLFTIEHASSGLENASAVDVAGKVLVEIRRAEALAVALGSLEPVRVKVDTVGLGWGVTSQLTRWGTEGRHGAQIVAVNVAESTGRKDDTAPMTPARKRDEMWIAGRTLVQPDPVSGESRTRLRVDKHTLRQLSTPSYKTSTAGLIEVETKKSMKARGEKSPDRAEALLLAAYEPKLKRAARLII